MTQYALINPNGGVDRFSSSVSPDVATKDGWVWVPAVEVRPDTFDPATQVMEGPVDKVSPTRLTRTWAARAKTAGEISAEKDSKIDALDALQLTVLFDHENRLRALEGKAAVTAAQFRAALKARL